MGRMLAAVALVVIGAVALPARAQTNSLEKADLLYGEARKLFQEGQFEPAAKAFEAAYATYPQAKYVFGIASCHEKLGNLPRALDSYELFTQYESTPDILKRVTDETTRLKESLALEYGEVFVVSSPDKAAIIIGEISKQNRFETPTRRWLKEGEHAILFQRDGSQPRELKISVKRGEHIYLYVGLKDAAR